MIRPLLLSVLLAAAVLPTAAAAQELRVAGVDHVGINVPDAQAAADFFHDLIGTRIVSEMHPAPVSADWKKRFRWHASTRIKRLVMLQALDGSKIELFEYDAPRGSKRQPHEDDAGATHIALKALDIPHSQAVVKRRGLRVLNDPVTLPDGTRWFYFLTPWGSQIELVFAPK
jgi:catechol 2,3-dioxygenase-like lactoylglutathione lyase family enzyme